ncbi:MAG: non-canonical purine NTP pyrophosphatase [Patescibacteria group bacterium]|nr:non-canonical purine NTP pyrophosphatase [Patescibacteria group bacterium]
MKKKILVATTNSGKIAEISKFLKDLPFKIVSLSDVGANIDIKETGKTYKENSKLKALFYAKLSNLPAISDDGGIEITALGGAPGIKSRRWLGYEATDKEIIEHMKKIARKLPDNNRTAYFKTVITFALPSGKYFQSTGIVKGEIAKEPLLKILKGYPYRSFFYIPKIKKFYHESQLSKDEERVYNHRYKAITKLKPIIKRELGL